MIITATQNPQKFQEVFQKATRIAIQIKVGTGVVTIAKDQGEIANSQNGIGDGLSLSQSGTITPWADWWKGELWYSTNISSQQFVLEILTD